MNIYTNSRRCRALLQAVKDGQPVYYSKLLPFERRHVREAFAHKQGERCDHCGQPLLGSPPRPLPEVDITLFPRGFFDNPVHLHHDHDTDECIGAVHAHCNAVMWQYHGE